MPTDTQPARSTRARQRAKQACRQCNARRVRCNVTESHPCTNCQSSGAPCEVVQSKRGRYPRKSGANHVSGALLGERNGPATPASLPPPPRVNTPSLDQHTSPSRPEIVSRPTPATPQSASLPPGTASSFFFGESNLLTCVPRSTPASNPLHSNHSYPGMFSTSRSSNPVVENHSESTGQYLRDEGALTFPDLQSCLPALRAYFTWFHPCFPVVNRAETASQLSTMNISPLLFQAMLLVASTYCDESTISSMGFRHRFEAKSSFYNRARLLFDADWEKDQLTVLQSLFLMSFWRGGPSNLRDVRYWLGVTINLAQTFGLHRSIRFTTRSPDVASLRRRIWWSIYVRERQAAASLGLPSRIRDEDCDIEMIDPADLVSDMDNSPETAFGAFRQEQIVYITKMVEIARLLGRIIDVHFVPGRMPSTREDVQQLKHALEQWRESLPEEMRAAPEPEQSSVRTCLLHLAYNHLRILIHRGGFLRNGDMAEKQAAVNAACRISRISEDMLGQRTIRFGQMHLITALFAALCIHVIEIRTADGVSKRLAENRAQMCLLGLKEIQNYWSINNLVLDLFFQYLDESTARRLHGGQADSRRQQQPNDADSQIGRRDVEDIPDANSSQHVISSHRTQSDALESDLYLNFFSTSWEGVNDSVLDLGFLFDPQQRLDNIAQMR